MSKKYIIGLDIGGFQIKGVLFKDNRAIKFLKTETPGKRQMILAAIFGLIENLSGRLPTGLIKGIGIGSAGVFNLKKSVILRSPNIKALDGLKIKKIIEDKLRLSVLLDNDADCFLRAEMNLGAGRGYKNAVGVTLGTGVGGAIAIDGKILPGANSAAGEIGHMVMQVSAKGGPAARFASPLRLGDEASEARRAGGKSFLDFEDLCSVKFFKRLGLKNGLGLREQAEKGDKKAKEIFAQYGHGLGIGLANLVNILDPEVIILGGGISEAAKFFLASAQKQMANLILSPLAKKRVKIKVTKLGKKAGAVGAALLFE